VHIDSVADWCSTIEKTSEGEENTASATNLTLPVMLTTALVRVHYLLLSPLIILGITPEAVGNQNLIIIVLVVLTGLAGMIIRRRQLATLASASLLGLLLWGKIAADLLKASPPDSALFLVEFGMVIFFMEGNSVVSTFYASHREMAEKKDELSQVLEVRLRLWLRNQLSRQGGIAIGSIGLSVVLLPLAGLTSISSSELPVTGALLFLAIVALLFLVTHRREPGDR